MNLIRVVTIFKLIQEIFFQIMFEGVKIISVLVDQLTISG